MKEDKYNGWTNYATWRIFTDNLIDIEWEERVTAGGLREIVEDIMFDNFEIKKGSHLVKDYARVFIEGVNFYEIAENINYDID
tara:strand:+ start:1299 stop:1547 length:249 start_codon:yes stop_codon:yes gene_type:complete